ncbi:MAG: PAS domain-containing sensor histidine kinase [Armatimonadota bacterium]
MAQPKPKYDFDSPPVEKSPDAVPQRTAMDVDSWYLSQRALRLWAFAFGAVGMLIGLLGLIARLTGHILLGSFIPGTKVISPAAALGLLALGALVVLVALVRNGSLKRVAVPACLLTLLQVLILLEHVESIPIRLTSLFLPDCFAAQVDPRASVPAAITIALLSLCLVFWTQWHRRHLAMTLAAIAGTLMLPFALGYVYANPLLYGSSFNPVAAPAAIGILSLAVGLYLASFASVQALRARDACAEARRREATDRLAQELRARGDELEAIINSCADSIMICDMRGNVVRTNSAFVRMLGYTEEDLRLPLSQRAGLFMPHDVSGRPLDTSELPLTRALAGETVTNCPLILLPQTDRERAIVVTASPLRSSEGDPSGAVLTVTDVSDLHRAQKALHESENRYRTASELIPYGFWTSDTTGDTTYVSRNFLELLGLTFEQLKQLGWEQVFHPDDAASLLAEWYTAVAERRYFSNEFRVRTGEGGYHWILGRGMPLLNAEGQFVGYVGVNIDIAELKQAQHERELALRELEQERRVLETTLEQMPAAVMAVAQPGSTVVKMNRQAREMLGTTAEEQRDLTDASLQLMELDGTPIPPEQWPLVRALYRGERIESGEYLLEANGTRRTIRGHVAATMDENGDVTGAILTFYDISREKALEAEREALARDAQRQADELQAIINSIADGVSITDATGTLIRCNQAARRMLRYEGYEDAAWESRSRRCTYLRPDGTEFDHEDLPLSRTLRGETVTGEIIHMVWPDGSATWVTSSSAPLRDAQGNLLGTVLTNTDMTALRETQQETQRLLAQVERHRDHLEDLILERTARLAESERKYRELVESANAAILRYDANGHLTLANRYAHELFGYAPGELLGKPVTTILPESDNSGASLKFLKDALLNDPDEWKYNENENITSDGRLLWLSWSNHVSLNEAGEPLDVLSVGIDRTAQHEGEQQLRDYQKRLRALASEVVNAEQRERQRVATLLHDEVAQTLGALKLHLSLLPGKWPEAAADVVPLIEMSDDAVQQTRIIMTQLSPPILQRFGVVEAIRWWAGVMQEREGLRVRVEAPEAPVRVDAVRKITVFQAVKELLRNVVKHSGASEATVTVRLDETTLHVEVSDNGRGFDPNATTTTATEGFGLFGVRERLVHLGGSMTVFSKPHQGSRIVLRLPRTL